MNVVDDPDRCSFILPALLRRGALCLAISTGGASPTFARRLREQLEAEFGPEYAALLELLSSLRQQWEPRAKAAHLPADARRRAWERVLDLPLLDWLRKGEINMAINEAEVILEEMISAREKLHEQRKAALARISEHRRKLPPTPPDAPDSLTMLREDRER